MGSLLADRFRNAVSKKKDNRVKSESEFGVGYSTGFLSFDFMNGNVIHTKVNGNELKYYSIGITDGSYVLFIGRSGSGKSTLCLQMASNIVRPFPESIIYHDDIEGGMSDIRKLILMKFTEEEFANKYISRNTGITAENFYERIRLIHDLKQEDRDKYEYDTGYYDSFGRRVYKLQPTVYILDSLALLMPDKVADEDELSGSMSATATAKVVASVFKRIIPLLKSVNIILFVINHINQKVDINPMMRKKAQVSYLKQDETLPGGNAPIYLANTMIRVDDCGKLKETEGFGIAGNLTDLQLIKSRTAKAGSICSLVFNQDFGFDKDLSLFLLLKNMGRIGGAGAYLTIPPCEVKFSQKQFKTKLAENVELQQAFNTAVRECLDTLINDNYALIISNEVNSYDVSASILAELQPVV